MCRHDRPEHEMTDQGISWRQPHQSCDHDLSYKWGCRDAQDNGVVRRRPDPRSMHLTALRVCRQMYNKANNVFWTTNTFSFDDANPTLVDFMESRTTRQKQLLRKLRLQMNWIYEDDRGWNRVLGVRRLRSLTELRSLRLQINHSMNAAVYQEAEPRGNEPSLFQPQQWDSVLRIETLPLTDVEVFVSVFPQDISDYPVFESDIVDPPRNLSVLWTAEDRME